MFLKYISFCKKFNIYFFILLLWSKLYSQTIGSVTQGIGITTTSNLLPNCLSNHITPIGFITSSDNKVWTVPASNNFLTGPFISDLYNTCNNVAPLNLASINLSSVPITVIDIGGDIITGYIFADNYFELYINGVLIGVDPVPFTPFNSCVVKFKVSKPYTIAIKLVDWEENLGVGTEIQSATSLFHPGDGGFIAQFSDGTVTDVSWKAQTFYIAPIQDLNSVVELPDGTHSSASANLTPTCNANCYGIHYDVPLNWNVSNFNDSGWPNAIFYTPTQVTNSSAYTNFAATAWNNASFIWTSNLILDNLVLIRKTVGLPIGLNNLKQPSITNITNPFKNKINFYCSIDLNNANLTLLDLAGNEILKWSEINSIANEKIELIINNSIDEGLYLLQVKEHDFIKTFKLIHN